jgi:hypothetical protein
VPTLVGDSAMWIPVDIIYFWKVQPTDCTMQRAT